MIRDKKRYLIFGACGMLAGHVIEGFRQKGVEPELADHAAFSSDSSSDPFKKNHPALNSPIIRADITDPKSVRQICEERRPGVILNLAAYTAVDKAESEPDVAYAVNALGPGILSEAAARIGALIVHISSDYVFGGPGAEASRKTPWSETDEIHPCGRYGAAKAKGDELVIQNNRENHLIVRTAWLHGIYGPNFIDTIWKAARDRADSREPLKVVADQYGTPTWAGFLAEAIWTLVEYEKRGTFHAASKNVTTWHEFASAIISAAKLDLEVLKITSAELNRPAPRPAYSALSTEKLSRLNLLHLPTWQEGLNSHLSQRSPIAV
jgi:dTDP-4-dehydrorhamnose reductase